MAFAEDDNFLPRLTMLSLKSLSPQPRHCLTTKFQHEKVIGNRDITFRNHLMESS